MQNERIIIRRAIEEDAELLSQLSAQTFYEAFAAFNTQEDLSMHLQQYYAKEKLAEELCDEQVLFLLAYYEEELAGYVKISEHPSPDEEKDLDTPIELQRIYSLQKTIGKGIGSALMQATIDYAKSKNKKTLWLGVWQTNETAIAFYKKWGFEIYSDHVFVLGSDPQMDWLMKKAL
jgi:ribosomal protein S18 acetylase RimI-like enzyme